MGDQRNEELTARALRKCVGAFVDGLARAGVRHACICPGSRSTPLALLLREQPQIRVSVHLDERSASYFALGIAKELREPVALVSTSGTAAVNFGPAVVEAYYARVPLLLLTADRPPELRGVGAPQTIEQARLFGTHAKWFAEMPLPDASPETERQFGAAAGRAVALASGEPRGPVHLNFPFREPLIPAAPEASDGSAAAPPPEFRADAPEHASAVSLDGPEVSRLADALRSAERPLIVCGPQDDPQFAASLMGLAQVLDAPVLADPLSRVRCGPHHGPLVIDAYDAFLRDDSTSRSLAPDVVLRFGATPVSKPLQQYLGRHSDARHVLVDAGARWSDPTHTATDFVQADPRTLCDAVTEGLRIDARTSSEWAGRWQTVTSSARSALAQRLESERSLSEPGVLAELAGLLPEGATLFAGNSMPVRDLDTFFPGGDRAVRFLANRGASGIDGVVSSALGASAVSNGPLVLVIGDLSFYHDMNGLLTAGRFGLNATIILLNNDGGGIFSFLPQAELPEHFEELFGTPHGLDFRSVAELYGLSHARPESTAELREAIRRSLDEPGVDVVEVRTDREANVRLHRELWQAVSDSLRESSRQEATP